MIVLERIVLNNFISFQYQEFEFKNGRFLVLGENLDSLISQSNGSGKTSLFQAIRFVIYGKVERDYQREGTNDTFVELDFSFNGSEFIIKRYYKHYSEKNNVEVFKDGELVNFHTKKQTQEYIQSIFKLSYENFISSVVYGQGLTTSILDLTPTKRKEYFSNLISADFDNIEKSVKTDLKVLEVNLNNQKGIVNQIKQELSFLKGQYKGLLQSSLNKEKDKSLKNQILNLNQWIDKLSNKISEIDDQINKISEHRQKKYIEFSNKKAQYEYEYKQLIKFKDGICPLCKRIVEDSEKIQQRIKQLSVVLQREFVYPYNDKYKELIKEKDELLKKLKQFENERSKLEYKLSISDKAKKELQDLKNKIDDLENKLNLEDDKLGDLEIECEELKSFYNLVKPSGQLRSIVLVNYIEVYNYLLKNMASSISEWKNVRLEFEDNMTGLVVKGVAYQNLSGGEKKRLQLLLQLTFSEFLKIVNSFGINIIVLDEVFENLDRQAVASIFNVLEQMYGDSGDNLSLYFISHNDELSQFFDKAIVIEKKNGISEVVE